MIFHPHQEIAGDIRKLPHTNDVLSLCKNPVIGFAILVRIVHAIEKQGEAELTSEEIQMLNESSYPQDAVEFIIPMMNRTALSVTQYRRMKRYTSNSKRRFRQLKTKQWLTTPKGRYTFCRMAGNEHDHPRVMFEEGIIIY